MSTLNAEARQNVVIVSGKRQMVQDALLKAQVRWGPLEFVGVHLSPLELGLSAGFMLVGVSLWWWVRSTRVGVRFSGLFEAVPPPKIRCYLE